MAPPVDDNNTHLSSSSSHHHHHPHDAAGSSTNSSDGYVANPSFCNPEVPVLLRLIDDECHSFLDDLDDYSQTLEFPAADESRSPDETMTRVDVTKLAAAGGILSSSSSSGYDGGDPKSAIADHEPKSILLRRGLQQQKLQEEEPPPPPPPPISILSKKVSFRSKSGESRTECAEEEKAANDKITDNPIAIVMPPPPQYKRGTNKKGSKKFFSQPMPKRSVVVEEATKRSVGDAAAVAASLRSRSGPILHRSDAGGGAMQRRRQEEEEEDNNESLYALFQTKNNKPGNYRRQFSNLLSMKKVQAVDVEKNSCSQPAAPTTTGKAMPAGRYFDALKGPELETLKDCEEPLLPLDQQWPFLLRFPIGSFGICLGLGSQTILWKMLASTETMRFLRVPDAANLALWWLAVAALVAVTAVYGWKCARYWEAVRREYYHPVRVNFFFAPWIAGMFVTIGVPDIVAEEISPLMWCIWTAPIVALELKIYGQWLSGGARRLSRVANPSTHLSLVGNFISSILASVVGWREAAIFFWSVGAAHYLVVFVTLYQRLPTSDSLLHLPKDLHPVFFLFVAAPSAASIAWKAINDGHFDYVSRLPYFLALFLYASLVVRLNFFYGFKFSLTWWAYTFPMTAAAIATIHYSMEVRHPITQAMAVILSFISSSVVLCVFVTTVVQAFTGRLFPNDLAIAIATKRKKKKRKGILIWKEEDKEEKKAEEHVMSS